MKTVYILGAGASIAESEYRYFRETENMIQFPALKDFFIIAKQLGTGKTEKDHFKILTYNTNELWGLLKRRLFINDEGVLRNNYYLLNSHTDINFNLDKNFNSIKRGIFYILKLSENMLKDKNYIKLFNFLQDKLLISYEKLENAVPDIETLISFLYYASDSASELLHEAHYMYSYFTHFVAEVFARLQLAVKTDKPMLHSMLLGKIKKEDTVISLNYDLFMDLAIKQKYNDWDGKTYYGIKCGKYYNGKDWVENDKNNNSTKIRYIKLHGSINWFTSTGYAFRERGTAVLDCSKEFIKGTLYIVPPEYTLEVFATAKQHYILISNRKVLINSEILTPIIDKEYNKNLLLLAKSEIHKADHIVFIGYSLPKTDKDILKLLQKKPKDRSTRLTIVNTDYNVRQKYKNILKRNTEYYPSFEAYLGLI